LRLRWFGLIFAPQAALYDVRHAADDRQARVVVRGHSLMVDRPRHPERLHIDSDRIVEAHEDALLLGVIRIAENLLARDEPTHFNLRYARDIAAGITVPPLWSRFSDPICPASLVAEALHGVGTKAHGRLIVCGEPEGIAGLGDLAEVPVVDVVGDDDVPRPASPEDSAPAIPTSMTMSGRQYSNRSRVASPAATFPRSAIIPSTKRPWPSAAWK